MLEKINATILMVAPLLLLQTLLVSLLLLCLPGSSQCDMLDSEVLTFRAVQI